MRPPTGLKGGLLAWPKRNASVPLQSASPRGRWVEQIVGCTLGGLRRALCMGAAWCRLFCCLLGLKASSVMFVSQCCFQASHGVLGHAASKEAPPHWGPVCVNLWLPSCHCLSWLWVLVWSCILQSQAP